MRERIYFYPRKDAKGRREKGTGNREEKGREKIEKK